MLYGRAPNWNGMEVITSRRSTEINMLVLPLREEAKAVVSGVLCIGHRSSLRSYIQLRPRCKPVSFAGF